MKTLFRAALAEGGEAIRAWDKYQHRLSRDELPEEVYQLLPLLYQNLRTLGVNCSLMNKLKGIKRLTWYKNRLILQKLSSLVADFKRSGIRTLLLEDAASVLSVYRDVSLRPVHAIALCIDTENSDTATRLLGKHGWRPRSGLPGANPAMLAGRRFVSGNDDMVELELRWHVLQQCCYPDADVPFWQQATTVECEHTPILAPDRTDHLFCLCILASQSNTGDATLYIADAAVLVKTAHAEIDWQRLAAHARNYRLVLPLKNVLNYLHDDLDVEIPASVLSAIDKSPVSVTERLEYKYNYTKKQSNRNLLGNLPLLWFDYRRRANGRNYACRSDGFLNYLKEYWQLESVGEVYAFMIFLSRRRLRNKLVKVRKSGILRSSCN